MSFLHGIEHIDLPADFSPANDVVTAVIGLIGTAEKGAQNELILCSSAKNDAQFGTTGTIPEALKAIRLQDSKRGSALVIVVNVKAADAQITPADIIGEVSETGERTGLKLFETALLKFGFEPMIYIAPRYSALAAIKTELIAITNKSEVMAYIDTPDGMTYTEVLASRNGSGQFATLNEGQKLLFPHFLVANPDYVAPEEGEEATEPEFLNIPMSAYAAGLRAKVDLEDGWHVSSSNHAFTGVDGLDVALTFGLGDTTCEVNMLNAQGVTTAVNMYGGGIVEWGNYTAGYPGNMNTEAFECVRRTRAIMKRAIQKACIPFIDKPLIQANIDAIRNTVNQYLNTLKAQNRILYGICMYRKENNPLNELAQGHVTFDIEFTPAIPMQRLTYSYKIDLTQLSNIA
ncbi:phage tail sheath subtilisin-like domain-containing protein [Paludibacteraceae bacterium OttesenSCG-928-F17]|nr:phage tail sheath subtilisin-like domain-containing protein [Paludibacteraceae bacterium OttesenSCG-928-F17]